MYFSQVLWAKSHVKGSDLSSGKVEAEMSQATVGTARHSIALRHPSVPFCFSRYPLPPSAMYNVDAYLKSLTSNAVKLSRKVQDGIAENTRDFRFENQAHFLDTNDDKMRYPTSQRPQFMTSLSRRNNQLTFFRAFSFCYLREIRKDLDSRYEKEKLDGLKRLIAVCLAAPDIDNRLDTLDGRRLC